MIKIEKLPSQLTASELVKLLQEQIKNGGDAPVFIELAGCFANVRIIDRYNDGGIRLSYN